VRLQPLYASLIGGAPRRSSGSLAKFAAAPWRLVLGEPLQAYSIVRAGAGVPGKLAFRSNYLSEEHYQQARQRGAEDKY
jgi:hypothetical protein